MVAGDVECDGVVVVVVAAEPEMLDQREVTEQREAKQKDLLVLLQGMVMWTGSGRGRLQSRQRVEVGMIRPALSQERVW